MDDVYDVRETRDARFCYRMLDWSRALENASGNRDLLREIASMFLEEAPRLLEDLEQALARADARGVERAAHDLRGCAGHFAAAPVLEAAGEMERAGRTDELEQAGPALARLND